MFRSSERSTMTELDTDLIPPIPTQTDTVTGIVKGVTMSSFEPKYQCMYCNDIVEVDGSAAACVKCDQMLTLSSLIKVCKIQFTITDTNHNDRKLICDHEILSTFLSMNLDNKLHAMKNFLNSVILATYEVQSGSVTTLERAVNADDMQLFD